ncbi:Hachiman antiphage defense system protein HamA [Desulfoscipio gibsoniae]|uniref:Anti-bacteriophage protein A/HamA C-terminal domain-containing protein n=1 Tax=Desulfoscipio gibsoniae DSM 7213 TaxID=767817 RepID=R4KPF1_9FIRM|nr:Hachiman antiphage defense system protein HamA [Desulfoscipio gibsoniae]AGL02470.1 protein of unknown function (DUF1837) [Desulfoscipio gibsoniae DSM 7213]
MYDIKKFNDFAVHLLDNQTSFLHINLADSHSFYRGLFDYFFEESRLLRYAENKTNLHFEPTVKNYVTLFKHLGLYIDDFNIQQVPASIEKEVLRILSDEYELEDAGNGQLKVRLDKMGKIGEYIFCNLLSEYFGFDCIIPKVHLTTDPNMNVYGIDTLFYSRESDMILFGESKLSKSLSNGIGLINKSLITYEKQIKDEFSLMLSNRFFKNNMGIFGDKYADVVELCLSIENFIEKADVKKIGIPIFIAHGTNITPDEIFDKLNKIQKTTILGLETIYVIISLPIFDKSKMISVFTQGIAERRVYYEREATK